MDLFNLQCRRIASSFYPTKSTSTLCSSSNS
nr:MAG TPA: hypothetical protein [Caudoviricetes sp.]